MQHFYLPQSTKTILSALFCFFTLPLFGQLPFYEDFETAGGSTYTADNSSLTGLPEWSYLQSGIGRLRFNAGPSFPFSGTNAATLDANGVAPITDTNYLILELDLSAYAGATDIELGFVFMHHGDEEHANDRVWVRGSNSDPFVEIYNLFANQGSAGVYQIASGLDVDLTLSNAGQSFTSTFQVLFGQEDDFDASSTTATDGYTFDNISLVQSTPTLDVSSGMYNVGSCAYAPLTINSPTTLTFIDDLVTNALPVGFNFEFYENTFS